LIVRAKQKSNMADQISEELQVETVDNREFSHRINLETAKAKNTKHKRSLAPVIENMRIQEDESP